MSQTLLSGALYIKLVAGDSFNIGSVLNDQNNRMIERMYIECNTVGSGDVTIQLPTFEYLAGNLNFEVIITDTGNNASVNNIVLLAGSGNTINGAASSTMTVNKSALFITGGTQSDWAAIPSGSATGAGVGTVTSFSSGNLSPLFTTSVATATSTPALSFSLATQAANTVFAGPATGEGGPQAPTFRALVAADLAGLGAGTVTSFSSGDLSPLFTTSVATATTTPALSFTLSSHEIHTVFAAPASGSPDVPTFRLLEGSDLPINAAVGTALTLETTNYLSLTIGVTTYKIALVND